MTFSVHDLEWSAPNDSKSSRDVILPPPANRHPITIESHALRPPWWARTTDVFYKCLRDSNDLLGWTIAKVGQSVSLTTHAWDRRFWGLQGCNKSWPTNLSRLELLGTQISVVRNCGSIWTTRCFTQEAQRGYPNPTTRHPYLIICYHPLLRLLYSLIPVVALHLNVTTQARKP